MSRAPSLRTRAEGENVVLRAPARADLKALVALQERNAEHRRPWGPLPPPGVTPDSPAAVAREIKAARREWREDRGYRMVIELRDDPGQLVGRASLSQVWRGNFGSCYLGYWIDQEMQGRGLMTDAVRTITSFAFGTLRLHRVQANVVPRNVASLRVLEKAGYRREGLAERYLQLAGVWEDHLMHAVTVEEWPRA
jgi:ribosomal-protein-alanine N-acetyltransferase